ncbi:MAG: polyamine aminopropyltransferase [Nitrospirota bacterium]
MTEPKSFKWFLEYTTPEEAHMHSLKTILYSTNTRFQQMEIMDIGSYGKCLVLDGKMQSSEIDEFIYHEALVHPAMLTHPEPKNIFIVGGGEGATLREVLRHRSVKKAIMVDIDEEVVEKCKELLPQWHQGAFDDPRTELKFLDARRYLEETSDKYDIIVIDIPEPVEEGPAYLLYTREFYEMVKDRLNDDGIISLQAGATAINNLLNFTAVNKTLRAVFPVVAPYYASIPSFSIPWGFTLASKRFDPRDIPVDEADSRIRKRISGELGYYDGITHQGQFMLPKYIRYELERQEKIIEDNAPLFTYR